MCKAFANCVILQIFNVFSLSLRDNINLYVFLYNMLRDLLLENDKLQQIVNKIIPVSCKNVTDLSSIEDTLIS